MKNFKYFKLSSSSMDEHKIFLIEKRPASLSYWYIAFCQPFNGRLTNCYRGLHMLRDILNKPVTFGLLEQPKYQDV